MDWTRRNFIASSAATTLLTQIAPAASGGAQTLDPATRERLRAVMDEIIPKEGMMPAASEAGGLEYFEGLKRTEPAVAEEVTRALDQVDHSAQTREALEKLEKQKPLAFAVLRDFVYEAYYTQPQVWKLIGYEFHATDHRGPHMKPFDESSIAVVRNKPKYYREA